MKAKITKWTKPGQGFAPKTRAGIVLTDGRGKGAWKHKGRLELSGASERLELPSPEADVFGVVVHQDGTSPVPTRAPLRGQWRVKATSTTGDTMELTVSFTRSAGGAVISISRSWTVSRSSTSSTPWRWSITFRGRDGMEPPAEQGEAPSLGAACLAAWERVGEVVTLTAGTRALHARRPSGPGQDEAWFRPARVAALATPAPVEAPAPASAPAKGKAAGGASKQGRLL